MLSGKLLYKVRTFDPIDFKIRIGLFYGSNKLFEAASALIFLVDRNNVIGRL